MTDIRDLTLAELRAELEAMGQPLFRADQIFGRIYRKGATRFGQLAELPASLRDALAAKFSFTPFSLERVLESLDGTRKFLFRLGDRRAVETVLIPSGERRTVCLSTQVGCKFRCLFCASGMRGFVRNLFPSEIVEQVLFLRRSLDIGVTNLVFMGMGEPLDNLDHVVRAIRILNDRLGPGLASRRMTVSTSGIVPGIERLARLGLQINLSLSLHAADPEKRTRLMPVNRKYPLADVLRACEEYLAGGGRKMTLEYVLIKGQNDAARDAEGLARIARRLKAKVNLIPFSPVPEFSFETPGDEACRRFLQRLEKKGVGATLRRSKGRDIAAACGQLAGGA